MPDTIKLFHTLKLFFLESCCYDISTGTTYATPGNTSPVPTASTSTRATTTTTISTIPHTSVAPVTSATSPAASTCSPGSYAAVTNGLCVPASLIGQSCKGKQISPSIDCGQNEFCCFVADSPTGGFYQPGVTCSPDSNPMIGNGRCVDPGQVASQCPGQLLSNSANCQPSQLCCYNIPSTTARPVTTTTTELLTVPMITTVSTTPATTTVCTAVAEFVSILKFGNFLEMFCDPFSMKNITQIPSHLAPLWLPLIKKKVSAMWVCILLEFFRY